MALFCTSANLLNVWCNRSHLDSHKRIQFAALFHLCIWEKQEWKRNAMPWYYSNNTFHLEDSPGRDSENPWDGEKSLWQKADLPLATRHSKDPLFLSRGKRHKVVRKGRCVPLNPLPHTALSGGGASVQQELGERDLNLDTHKSNTSGGQPGYTAF